jgi:hypothetical protein
MKRRPDEELTPEALETRQKRRTYLAKRKVEVKVIGGGGFTKVSNHIIRNTLGLTMIEVRVWVIVRSLENANHPTHPGWAWPSNDQIAKMVPCSLTAVTQAIGSLVRKGLLLTVPPDKVGEATYKKTVDPPAQPSVKTLATAAQVDALVAQNSQSPASEGDQPAAFRSSSGDEMVHRHAVNGSPSSDELVHHHATTINTKGTKTTGTTTPTDTSTNVDGLSAVLGGPPLEPQGDHHDTSNVGTPEGVLAVSSSGTDDPAPPLAEHDDEQQRTQLAELRRVFETRPERERAYEDERQRMIDELHAAPAIAAPVPPPSGVEELPDCLAAAKAVFPDMVGPILPASKPPDASRAIPLGLTPEDLVATAHEAEENPVNRSDGTEGSDEPK